MKNSALFVRSITLFLLVILFSTAQLFAQPGTNIEKLRGNATRLQQKWAEQQARVENYARRNNVPVRQKFPDGRVMEMIDVINGIPKYYTTTNINAAATTRADKLWDPAGLGLDGSGYSDMAIWDAGAVLSTHVEFNNTGESRIIITDGASTTDDHATHVAGTMVAGGVDPGAKGMAFNAILK